MTNTEIKEAIKEIIRIKSLKYREQELRQKIFKELRKRCKGKLQLGGEDFVKIITVDTKESNPGEKLFDRLAPVGSHCHDRLSYSLGLDDNNRLRGVDL